MREAIEKSQLEQGRIHEKAKEGETITTELYYETPQLELHKWVEKHNLTDFKDMDMTKPYNRRKLEKSFSVPIADNFNSEGDGLITMSTPVSWLDSEELLSCNNEPDRRIS